MTKTATAFISAGVNGPTASHRMYVTRATPQHDGHENPRHPVRGALDRRLGALRLLHHADYLGQHRFLAHLRGTELHRTVDVERGPGNGVVHAFRHGKALARQHGFINRSRTFQDDPVDRVFLAGPHHHDVVHTDLTHGNLSLLSVPDHTRRLRLKAHQLLDGFRGPAHGALFEHFSEHD